MGREPNAVDDIYSGCRDKMLEKVLGGDGLLLKELQTKNVFSEAWNATNCLKPIANGQQEHTQALQSISNSEKLLKELNTAVESKGGDVNMYTDQFHFKSLHFLLMDAMRLLKPKNCSTVYSGVFEEFTAVKGSEVRFGRFFSANKDRGFAEEGCADGGTLFNITSCSVIDVEEHVCGAEHVVLLIPPSEAFTVIDVKRGSDCDKEIVLMSTGLKNDHDCYLFPR